MALPQLTIDQVHRRIFIVAVGGAFILLGFPDTAYALPPIATGIQTLIGDFRDLLLYYIGPGVVLALLAFGAFQLYGNRGLGMASIVLAGIIGIALAAGPTLVRYFYGLGGGQAPQI